MEDQVEKEDKQNTPQKAERPHFDTSTKRPPPKPPATKPTGSEVAPSGGSDVALLSSSDSSSSLGIPVTRRYRIVHEMLTTERTYVKNIEFIMEVGQTCATWVLTRS